ncbi:MAG: CDP-alcohol phosphatidyltransferase family protein [Acidobacteria bacterium]|nr:CDP-alcohol phosphatidyltransferase family protein [Acidobacteriota bacterium]
MVRTAVLINLTRAPAERPLRLAGLPLVLRNVLAAQQAGIEEILAVGGEDPGRVLRDRRVKLRWRWVRSQAADEVNAVRVACSELRENAVLFFADSAFDARALEELSRAGLDGKLLRVARRAELAEELEPTGASLYLCSHELVGALEERKADPSISSRPEPSGRDSARDDNQVVASEGRLAELVAGLRQRGLADSVAVAGRLWSRVSSRAALRAIHRELTHFNLKPSDGVFARFNKLVVAEPLIRLALKTPATPNFITGLGLVLALLAAAAFIQGSYAWSLAGALLAYASAMMDHVDGMVARLKFLESEFGVWFESAVDYASYFAIFVGLALGLYRETGFRYHLVVGGLFVFGTIVSFVVMSRQRKLASADNPTDYPNRIHARLEAESKNFFHWFTRKCYFLTRRAVLPYVILLFCLLDLRVLLLGCVAFGSNLVWLLTLYNNRLFRPSPRATAEAD